MALIPIREALRAAMREEMQRDPSVFLMGEEVAQYDGAYKVSQGMLAEFGRSPSVASRASASARPWSACARSSSS